MPDDIKALVEDVNKSFQEFKTKNDQRLAELEKQRRDDPLLKEQVERLISETLDKDEIKTIKESMAEIEKKLSRPAFETQDPKDPKDVDVKMARDKLNAEGAEQLNPAQRKAMEAYAINVYIRKGEGGLSGAEMKLLSVDSDQQGGYLVTPEMSSQIIKKVFETSPMRQEATIETIGTDSLEINDDLDEADADWVVERGSRNETDTPNIGQRKIYVHEIYAQPKATQQLLEDASMDIESWLSGKVSDKMMRKENTAFVSGNGVGKPRGFLDYPAGTTNPGQIERINSGSASAVTADGLRKMPFQLKGPYLQNAKWYMNRSTISAIAQLTDDQSQYLWQPGLQQNVPMSLVGHQVVRFEDMPNVSSNALPIAFGDMRQAYTIVDRRGIRVLRDPFSSKPFVLFYTTKRTGGDVTNFEALKLQKIAS